MILVVLYDRIVIVIVNVYYHYHSTGLPTAFSTTVDDRLQPAWPSIRELPPEKAPETRFGIGRILQSGCAIRVS